MPLDRTRCRPLLQSFDFRVREADWTGGRSGEPVLQKLNPLFVSLDEEGTLAIVEVASRARANVVAPSGIG